MSQPNISVLVDYAHEPESMKQLLTTIASWRTRGLYDCIIHIVSCDGAGRDNWKKEIMGKISYDIADYSVVTLDNYDASDNPIEILAMLCKQLPPEQKDIKYQVTASRKKAFDLAIKKAIDLQKNYGRLTPDPLKILIVSTGVGSENGLTQPGGIMEWNESKEWEKSFQELMRIK
ncbi:MAG: hypothetical protein H7230_02805 [Candidatus Parcubacteria bacterium]|nr:hypothetical protein [Candidatus Paceibacterota bacterium]